MSVTVLRVVMALANVEVLSQQMFVSSHDATLVAVILVYSVGVGISAAVVIAQSDIAGDPPAHHDCRGLAECVQRRSTGSDST